MAAILLLQLPTETTVIADRGRQQTRRKSIDALTILYLGGVTHVRTRLYDQVRTYGFIFRLDGLNAERHGRNSVEMEKKKSHKNRSQALIYTHAHAHNLR